MNITSEKYDRVGRPKSAEKGEAILSAATRLFLDHGLKNTSMDEVATAAGVSKPTVYSHFGGKEDLYRRVIMDKCRQHRLSGENLPDAQDVRGALNLIADRYLSLMNDPEVIAM